MALIHFPAGLPLKPSVVWKNLNEKLEATDEEHPFQVSHADVSEEDGATLRAIELMAKRIETLGGTLQYTFRLAYTDPVSRSPNMLAIQRKLDLSLTEAMLEQTPLCLCLIDGDELKKYNNQGYEAGDDVIRKIERELWAPRCAPTISLAAGAWVMNLSSSCQPRASSKPWPSRRGCELPLNRLQAIGCIQRRFQWASRIIPGMGAAPLNCSRQPKSR